MSKHTDGPLEVRQFTRTDFAIAQVGKMPHAVVYPCGVESSADVNKCSEEQISRARADALLYSKAPKILEALEDLLSVLESYGDEFDICAELAKRPAATAARAIIAEAKGES